MKIKLSYWNLRKSGSSKPARHKQLRVIYEAHLEMMTTFQLSSKEGRNNKIYLLRIPSSVICWLRDKNFDSSTIVGTTKGLTD